MKRSGAHAPQVDISFLDRAALGGSKGGHGGDVVLTFARRGAARFLSPLAQVWDQNAFNDIFRRGAGEELPNRLFKAYNVRA